MNPTDQKIDTASVKVMRSHDYCHFEVCLSSSSADTPELIDELRKTAARLADKAVAQYCIAKLNASRLIGTESRKHYLGEEVKRILEMPEADRSPEQMAKVKLVADEAYWSRRESHYDYDDDWEDDNHDDDDEF